MKKRPWSKSEPLSLEKPKFDMISDSIWRTNSPQDKEQQQTSDPFSSPSKKLRSIPDNQPSNDKPDLFSPTTKKLIDDIITPQGMISPETIKDLQTPTEISKTASYADYFGFPNKKKNEMTLPATPPFIPQRREAAHSKDDQIANLQQQIKSLTEKLEKYAVDAPSPRPPSLGSASKRSINYLSQTTVNDDEKSEEEVEVIHEEKLTAIHKQKLARYAHFLTCPCCNKFDATTPRNVVLIPCGHLVCGKCSKEMDDTRECSLCNERIEGHQILVIG